MNVTIYTDGAARGNPGPGGYGAGLQQLGGAPLDLRGEIPSHQLGRQRMSGFPAPPRPVPTFLPDGQLRAAPSAPGRAGILSESVQGSSAGSALAGRLE